MYELICVIHTHIHYIYIYNDYNQSLKWQFKCVEMLQNDAISFILKQKTKGVGSGIALLCGFKVAQAKKPDKTYQ